MPFKIPSVAELEKQFTIDDVPGFIKPEDESDHIHVTFRQATGKEDDSREEFVFKLPITRTWTEESDFAQERYTPKAAGERRAYEVYLTMAACDIEKGDGDMLIKFSDIDGRRKVAGSFEKFKASWGLLPTKVRTVIHQKCLEANPHWGFNWQDDDSDEGK